MEETYAFAEFTCFSQTILVAHPRVSVVNGRHEIAYLYAARGVRGFGDGFAVIVLPAYLAEIGFNPFQIGVIATAALLGTALATLAIGHLGARHDLRNLLLLGAGVMIGSGLAFPNVEHFALVAIVAFF